MKLLDLPAGTTLQRGSERCTLQARTTIIRGKPVRYAILADGRSLRLTTLVGWTIVKT